MPGVPLDVNVICQRPTMVESSEPSARCANAVRRYPKRGAAADGGISPRGTESPLPHSARAAGTKAIEQTAAKIVMRVALAMGLISVSFRQEPAGSLRVDRDDRLHRRPVIESENQ